MSDSAISVHDLVKTFGSFRALDDMNLTVPTGAVTGFLGPNGSGKSTTIRVLLGLLRADSGTVRVLGQDPWTHAVALHRRLAYVPGDTHLWPSMTGGEAIDVLSGLRGGADPARRSELIERFELDPTKRVRTYSKGNRQKVALVAALCSRAELFLFDEPTSGLDPLMEAVFTEEVQSLRAAGGTVLLSSHILSEVEKLCDHVTIIRAGSCVESGTLEELRHLTRSHVQATVPTAAGADTDADVSAVAAAAGVHDLSLEGSSLRFAVDNASISEVLPHLSELSVTHLTITPPSLEELFMRHYETDGLPGSAGADAVAPRTNASPS